MEVWYGGVCDGILPYVFFVIVFSFLVWYGMVGMARYGMKSGTGGFLQLVGFNIICSISSFV